jgi:hypothetical protein
MSCTIIVGHNPLDRDSWQRYENIDDFGQFLLDVFAPSYNGHFPSSGRIYLEKIDEEHDITPATPAAAEALRKIDGTVYVMVWPKDPGTATAIAVNLAITVIGYAIKEFLRPKTHPAEQRRIPKGSPNNAPGERRNSARVGERIPDIYGQVRITPDLLAVPYITYENNLQQETSFMCIGHDEYNIDTSQIFEGDTQVRQLQGTSVQIYGPGNGPGDTPQLSIGDTITDGLYIVVPVDNVKGDTLPAPNQLAIYNDDVYLWKKDGKKKDNVLAEPVATGVNIPIEYSYPSAGIGRAILTCSNSGIGTGGRVIQGVESDYITERFQIGTKFGIEWDVRGITVDPHALINGVGTAPDLRLMPETVDDDHYEVTDIIITPGPFFDMVEIQFTVPASVQPEWENLIVYNPSGFSDSGWALPAGSVWNFASIMYPIPKRIGPFFVNDPDREFFRLNFIAEGGLWIDDTKRQRAYPDGVTITVEFTPADEDGNATGPKETQEVVLTGASSSREFIGQTFDLTPSFPGRAIIAAYRSSNTINRHQSHGWETFNRAWTLGPLIELKPWDGVTPSDQWSLEYQDEVKWAHCYSMSVSPSNSFGNLTTLHCKVNQRKNQSPDTSDRRLNLIAIRKIRTWTGTELSPTLLPNRQGKDIIFDILTQRHLGDLDESRIDFNSVSDAFDAVVNSMGTEAGRFDHTFDSDNASLEDLLSSVATSCFMQLYRQGDIVKASPDISTEEATILFNHRNKIPGSETRTITFDTEEEYDGVVVSYHDDTNERINTFTLPAAGVPRNPLAVDMAGIHIRKKAMMHAWRAYYQLLFRNAYVEFEACEEAMLGLVNDKILVANNVSTDSQDGDIVAVDGLTVRTSQQLSIGFIPSTIFIQHTDGTTEAIAVASQDSPNTLTLSSAPSQTLYINTDEGIYPRYIVTRSATTIPTSFRVINREYRSPGVFRLTAGNYSEGFYFYDKIQIWLIFEPTAGYIPISAFQDRSPNELLCTQVNGATLAFDSTREKTVYSGVTAVDAIEVGPTFIGSYTVACWIFKPANTDPAFLLEDADTNDILFFVEGTTNFIKCQHETVTYVQGTLTLNEWVHVAVTYDESSEEMYLYVNGEVEDSAVSVPNFPASTIDAVVLRSLVGKADDYRMYNIAKSHEFIRTLYQKTRK